jgi:regulator of sirC expression with transglutaminase-like and TPR domain
VKERLEYEIRRDAIVSLLDDPSPIVMNALSKELIRMGRDGIVLLEQIAATDGQIALQARAWLKRLGSEVPADVFMDFIYSYNYELESGCLLLDRTIFPQLNMSEYYKDLEDISQRCRELLLIPSTVHEKCNVINRVIFHEFGFRGNTEDYYNPLNSYLHQVLKRKRGIPISLSILYLLVAERCNIQLEPIALPGHFLVGCFLEKEPFYIDPYHGGVFRTAKEVEAMVIEKLNQSDDIYLKPASVGAVLCRCCRNLANQYANEGNLDHSGFFAGFVRAFEDAYRKHATS